VVTGQLAFRAVSSLTIGDDAPQLCPSRLRAESIEALEPAGEQGRVLIESRWTGGIRRDGAEVAPSWSPDEQGNGTVLPNRAEEIEHPHMDSFGSTVLVQIVICGFPLLVSVSEV
jgi:hypothetical protein